MTTLRASDYRTEKTGSGGGVAVRRIDIPTFHAELRAQGVQNNNHCALKCVMCGTVQSMALMVKHGVAPEDAEKCIGFSCIGRWTKDLGCDWTLGGLFQLHALEVMDEDGKPHPRFEPATPEEAQSLERELTQTAPTPVPRVPLTTNNGERK